MSDEMSVEAPEIDGDVGDMPKDGAELDDDLSALADEELTDGEEGEEEAPSGPMTTEELAELLSGRTILIKAGGEEREITADKVLKYLQLGEGAYARMDEAAKAVKTAQSEKAQIESDLHEVIATLKDPDRFLDEVPDAYFEELLDAVSRRLNMTDEQRSHGRDKRELERMKAQQEADKRRQEEEQAAQELQQYIDGVQRAYAQAMDTANAPMERRPALVSQMARLHRQALGRGIQPDPAKLLEVAAKQLGIAIGEPEPPPPTPQDKLQALKKKANPSGKSKGTAPAPKKREPAKKKILRGANDWFSMLDS